MKVTMHSIVNRAHDMTVNCTIGRFASVWMGVSGIQLTASGIKDIRNGKLLMGCSKVSLGILSAPIAIRNYLAQNVHLDRESILAANMVDSIVNDPNASEKDRELAKSYQRIYMDRPAAEEGSDDAEDEEEEEDDDDDGEEKEKEDNPCSVFYQGLVNKVSPQIVAQNFSHILFNFSAAWHADVVTEIIDKHLIDALYADGTLSNLDKYFERSDAIQLLNAAPESPFILIKPSLKDYGTYNCRSNWFLTTNDMRFIYAYSEISKDRLRCSSEWLYPTLLNFSQWADDEEVWFLQATPDKSGKVRNVEYLSINLFRVPQKEFFSHSNLLETFAAILTRDGEDTAT